MKKCALITGITGQDGSYLAEFLLGMGYNVHGLIRRSSSFHTGRIDHIYPELHLHYADLTDLSGLTRLMIDIQPDEVYNLAAQSHVRVSFDQPIHTVDVNAVGMLRVLEAVREADKEIRVYQASSSEMFGNAPAPQNEFTRFEPCSPYACAKVYAYYQARCYREAYGMFICNGILFNHESPRRGETFVTRKITRAVGRIMHGLQERLVLGNLDAQRDWGYAPDYVKAMWLMLQREDPADFVIATGKSHSVREFLSMAFGAVGKKWQDYVDYDARYLRPADINLLRGDPALALKRLDWAPSISFETLVTTMVRHDLQLAKEEKAARSARDGG